jgi:hypothetical protein
MFILGFYTGPAEVKWPWTNPNSTRSSEAYKAAVERWIAAIKKEEALASVVHSVAEVDKWEAAHFAEDNVRNEVKAAKRRCPAPQVLRILLLRRPQGLSDFTRSPPITAD